MDKLKDLDQFKELRDSGKTVFVFMTGWCRIAITSAHSCLRWKINLRIFVSSR